MKYEAFLVLSLDCGYLGALVEYGDQMKDNFLVLECHHCESLEIDKHLFVPLRCSNWLISVQNSKAGYRSR